MTNHGSNQRDGPDNISTNGQPACYDMAKPQPNKNDSQNDSNYSIGCSHVTRHFSASKAWRFLCPCTRTNAFAGDLLQVKHLIGYFRGNTSNASTI